MTDVARAYRNGYINRGRQDQADYDAMIDTHNHGQRHPVRPQPEQVNLPPLPPGIPEDDNSKYTTIPPQPRQYAPRQVQSPRYRQREAQTQYAPAAPAPYQPAAEYAQAPVYRNEEPVYVQQAYAPAPPVQYVPAYVQPQYAQVPVIAAMVQPVAPVVYQAYPPPAYWSAPSMYAYQAPRMGYRIWR